MSLCVKFTGVCWLCCAGLATQTRQSETVDLLCGVVVTMGLAKQEHLGLCAVTDVGLHAVTDEGLCFYIFGE